ncbi:MAG: NUDIX hydrolase [Candidatus Moranbacteria bacterium]|nr:NUDIX hydrolase [Candidatus Moranbacteria bacterium]
MTIERPASKQPIPDHAKRVFEGVLFDVYQWEQELYDGSTTTFEKLKRPDTVVVFPVLDDGSILLTRQEKPGKEPFLGGAGGRVERDEDVLAAARRELLEETGYEASEFVLVDARQPTSKIDWAVFTFVAKGLRKVSTSNPDAGERIELEPVPFERFLELLTAESFSEPELARRAFEARLDPKKMSAFRRLLGR